MELVIKIDEKQKEEIANFGYANIDPDNLTINHLAPDPIVRKFLDRIRAITITDEEE